MTSSAARALKRVAIGRKNWLFAGNDAATASHAWLWSLIATCERHQVAPQRYLTSVLAKIRIDRKITSSFRGVHTSCARAV